MNKSGLVQVVLAFAVLFLTFVSTPQFTTNTPIENMTTTFSLDGKLIEQIFTLSLGAVGVVGCLLAWRIHQIVKKHRPVTPFDPRELLDVEL